MIRLLLTLAHFIKKADCLSNELSPLKKSIQKLTNKYKNIHNDISENITKNNNYEL